MDGMSFNLPNDMHVWLANMKVADFGTHRAKAWNTYHLYVCCARQVDLESIEAREVHIVMCL